MLHAITHVFYLATLPWRRRIARSLLSWASGNNTSVTLLFRECRWYKSKAGRLIPVPSMAWGWSQGPQPDCELLGGQALIRHVWLFHSARAQGWAHAWHSVKPCCQLELKGPVLWREHWIESQEPGCCSWCWLQFGICLSAIFSASLVRLGIK